MVGITTATTTTSWQYFLFRDEEEDYLMMSKLYDELYSGVPICLTEAMEWLNLNPSVASMNINVRDSKINEEISNRNKSSYVDFCGQVNW